jgi:hypothetical protein
MRYMANLVEHVVPQAPQRVKTKGRYNYRAAVGPGIQGRLLVLRGGNQVTLIMHYYLNVQAADERQKRSLERNLSNLAWLLREESGYNVKLVSLNYFYYFWRMKLFTGRRMPRGLRSQMGRYRATFPSVKEEQVVMSAHMHPLRLTRRAVRSWRRERYHARSFRPMMAAFMSQPFDADLVARTIAMELQILRIKHRRFMYYARRLIDMGFYYWNRGGVLQGLKLEIRGRMTNFRRQVRRAQTKTYRWGSMKKADLRVEASHCRHLAYNRYGVIGVSLTFQQRIRVAERWEDRSAQSPLRAFALKGLLEQLGQERQVLPDPEQSVHHETYGRAAPGVLDPAVSGVGSNTGLERFNRHCYYRERLGHFHREAAKPFGRPLLLMRPMFHDLEEGFANPQRFPVDEAASMASFQLSLRRQQQRRRALRGEAVAVAPTAYAKYRHNSREQLRGGVDRVDPVRSPQWRNVLKPHRRTRPWVQRRALSPAEAHELMGLRKTRLGLGNLAFEVRATVWEGW